MKNVGVISASIAGAILIGVGVGFGAVKIYQMISPVQKTADKETQKVVEQEPVDPVKNIRQLCDVAVAAPASKMYGNVNRELTGDTRETTTFTTIARVVQTNPVVLDVDVSSVKPTENPVFDEEMRKLPTYQFVVTDSAIHGLQFGDIIKASIEYSRPKNGEIMVNPTPKDKEVAVKLQNSLVVTNAEKQGIFAHNFTLFAMPASGYLYMASGDRYTYGFTSETTSGISEVKHVASDGKAEAIATQLAQLNLYTTAGKVSSKQNVQTYCGYAYTAIKKLNVHDKEILSALELK